jgi:predicted Zn-dependent peptidase
MTRGIVAAAAFLGLVLGSASPGSVVGAQAPDRRKPPVPGPAPGLKLPSIQKQRLSNGLPVWLVELHEVPVVQLSLVVRSGSSDDPPGRYGIASLTAAMLREGAGDRSALELAEAIEFLGADFTTASTFDAMSIRVHVPVSRLSGVLPLMADVAFRPRFAPADLDRLRRERLTGLLQARDDPGTVASLALSRVLYGAHRYGTGTTGTAATLGEFSVDDLRAFYRSAFRPDNATLLVVGDVEPRSALASFEAAFGRWTAEDPIPTRAATSTLPPRTGRAVYLLDKPGAPQSEIRIGRIGVPRSTPDYFPLQVMNTVLGGSFSSRLNLNLREKRGYTYGAGSFFEMREGPGPFSASAGVQTDKTADALKEFFAELAAIRHPVPAEELGRAKRYLALRYPGGFETTGDIVRRLEEMLVYDLPADYAATYVQRIQAVTAAEVEHAARAHIDPDRMVVVIVGDRGAIEGPVRALNLGPLTIMGADELF